MGRKMLNPIEFKDGKITLLDQTRLPEREVYLEITDLERLADAIKKLSVRGAPLLGITGAYGLALTAYYTDSKEDFLSNLSEAQSLLSATRPTATNLFSMMDRIVTKAESWIEEYKFKDLKEKVIQEAKEIHREDERLCDAIGEESNKIIPEEATLLTHCNAGILATGGIGTALSGMYKAHKEGKSIDVFVDETRPLLQGARLTVYELMEEGIDVTLITDNMAGYFMKKGAIDLIIVGADRIALNGDTANKIGTYSLGVLADRNDVPFYIAAPTTTIDSSAESEDEIPIEQRGGEEIRRINNEFITRNDVKTSSPAFDVTEARLIDGIITEQGTIENPNKEKITELLNR